MCLQQNLSRSQLHATRPATSLDYSTYYYLEEYPFDQVSSRFATDQTLSAFDFFCVVIWKANRAKSKVAERLRKRGGEDLENAVGTLVSEIVSANSKRDRLSVMLERWGFRLPMASAILTVLYPDEFTVYDVRVCDILGDFHDAQNKKFDTLWDRYVAYIDRVRASVPSKRKLRDKDRYLWGQSFATQLNQDIKAGFRKDTEIPFPACTLPNTL